MTETEMRAIVQAKADAIGSLRQAAKEWSVSPAYLSDMLNGRRAPGPSVIEQLGYERKVVVTYERRKA